MLVLSLIYSERADPQYCRDRITEGANINKSLVTLGIVISALGKQHTYTKLLIHNKFSQRYYNSLSVKFNTHNVDPWLN